MSKTTAFNLSVSCIRWAHGNSHSVNHGCVQYFVGLRLDARDQIARPAQILNSPPTHAEKKREAF